MSVAQSMDYVPVTGTLSLPDYLEDIVRASHPSLGESGRQLLRDLLLKYVHVFPAPGEPVTGRSKLVLHEIETNNARPVRCGPRHLAPAGLRKESPGSHLAPVRCRWGMWKSAIAGNAWLWTY